MLERFTVRDEPAAIGKAILARYGDLAGRVNLYLPYAAPAELLAGAFRTCLQSLQRNQDEVQELRLLDEAERRQQLDEWNETEQAYPQQCIHELFEQQVVRAPEAVAVIYGAEEVSYEELNRRANQLGHYLRRMGVGPETLVGVCLERSVEVVVALLGILKAGGAYVPLDPAYPADRLAYMLADAAPQVLLTLFWHVRSTPGVVARYPGTRVWAHEQLPWIERTRERVEVTDAFRLDAAGLRSLYVPAGLAHGFLTLEDDTEVAYLISTRYERESERGLRWDDPVLGISWPFAPTTISDRDRGFKLLESER